MDVPMYEKCSCCIRLLCDQLSDCHNYLCTLMYTKITDYLNCVKIVGISLSHAHTCLNEIFSLLYYLTE